MMDILNKLQFFLEIFLTAFSSEKKIKKERRGYLRKINWKDKTKIPDLLEKQDYYFVLWVLCQHPLFIYAIFGLKRLFNING